MQDESSYFWRNDDAFFRKSNFERICTSIGLPEKLREAKWESRFHFGTIEERELGGEKLADILVRGLGGNQDEKYLTSEESRTVMDLLVSRNLVARAGSKSHVGYRSLRPSEKATKSYRIGDPERKAAGLCIDPETKSATLTSNTTDTDSGDVVGYKPVCINSTNRGIKLDSNWKVAVKIDHFEILRVKGGIGTNVASERANTLVRYAPQHATEGRIKGEELSKRIQGFGSTTY